MTFLWELKNNNETFNINEEKHIPFLRTIPMIYIEDLYKYKINDEEIYAYLKLEKKHSLSNRIHEILKEDNLEKLQKIINEKGFKSIAYRMTSFREVEKINIPFIIECIIQKAMKCFKYLLINDFQDPTIHMFDVDRFVLDIFDYLWIIDYRYNLDCMGIAMYYGEVEIVKIFEEKGFDIENHPGYLEGAILSYRNSIVKRIKHPMNMKIFLKWKLIFENEMALLPIFKI